MIGAIIWAPEVSEYVYAGREWPIFSLECAYVKLTGGLIQGYKMTFKEQKVRCLNYGAVVANIDGTRVELSGEAT